MENEQDSIAINSDSLISDPRYRDKKGKSSDVEREMNSQSSATFFNRQFVGGYHKPSTICNIELLKDP